MAFIYFLKSNFLGLKVKRVVNELLVGKYSLLRSMFEILGMSYTLLFFDSADSKYTPWATAHPTPMSQ